MHWATGLLALGLGLSEVPLSTAVPWMGFSSSSSSSASSTTTLDPAAPTSTDDSSSSGGGGGSDGSRPDKPYTTIPVTQKNGSHFLSDKDIAGDWTVALDGSTTYVVRPQMGVWPSHVDDAPQHASVKTRGALIDEIMDQLKLNDRLFSEGAPDVINFGAEAYQDAEEKLVASWDDQNTDMVRKYEFESNVGLFCTTIKDEKIPDAEATREIFHQAFSAFNKAYRDKRPLTLAMDVGDAMGATLFTITIQDPQWQRTVFPKESTLQKIFYSPIAVWFVDRIMAKVYPHGNLPLFLREWEDHRPMT